MRRGSDLITATTLLKVAGMLTVTWVQDAAAMSLNSPDGLQKIMENLGRGPFVADVRTFFDIVDQCWGIRRVAYRDTAAFLKNGFLLTLARVLSDHANFWKDDHLFIDTPTLKKLGQFPVDDREIVRLSSSGGTASELLYHLMVDHINRGKRTKRLQLREGLYSTEFSAEDDDDRVVDVP